jgi:integrase
MAEKKKFTTQLLDGLKAPSEGQTDVWDTLLPCFGIRVGKKSKSFFVGVRIKRKFRRITLKPPYPALSLAKAREQARAIIADAQAGLAPELKKKREAAGTFGAVAEAFMQDHAKKLRTSGEYQRKINVDLAEWHDRQIADITRADIKELIRVKARAAPISANRLLALISKIFSWALKEELIAASPAMKLDRPGQETERERSLSPDEIKTAWGAFEKLGHPWGAFFKLLLVTGQRRGEVAGMKWSEITTEGWKLPGDRAKKGKGHLVPLSSLAREVLAAVPEFGDYVFRSSRNDAPLQKQSKATQRLYDLCGFAEPWHPHDLRRTFATQLRTLGVDKLVVSKLLNHAEAGVTKIYDRYSADPEKIAAMERWADRLREIISGTESSKVVQMRAKARRASP